MIRNPAFAGSFYPGEEKELLKMIDNFLAKAGKNIKAKKCRGVIVPHAGYVYSGLTQAYAYSAPIPERVIILGVNHAGAGSALSLFGGGTWIVPNGCAECDAEFAKELSKNMPSLKTDVVSHMREHSIEVQLPFLLRRNSDVKITPISMYDYSVESARALGAALAKTIEVFPGALIVASSDFTHCGPGYGQMPPSGMNAAGWAEKQDALAEKKILAMDTEGLFKTVHDNGISMCGLGPVMALMFALRGASPEKLYYNTSSSVSGDDLAAVGYAAYAFR
ncbi:AmmeMemoRadiSam system protein B [bacterium]|nr:AmmeMemoRadiSam system protein B [bacterium]MBU3955908.1 AmmeMemoRadiSam system protein B [bacterium]MBU4134679.1 AmmeMemoRadiSam system protein B [bacterium]